MTAVVPRGPALPDDPEAVRRPATRLLGGVIGAIERVSSFAGNRVFRVEVSAESSMRTVFLKFGPGADIAREDAAITVARRHGVPVPVIDAVDLDGSVAGAACIALRAVPGTPLAGVEPVFAAGVPPLLTRLHGITVDGFGIVATSSTGLVGQDRRWADALRRRVASAGAAVDAGLVPAVLVSAVAELVEADVAPLDLGLGRLLHGDLHPRHVYATNDRVTAVIDWGDATAGDPDYDLARLFHAGVLRGDLEGGLERVRVATGAPAHLDGDRLARLLTYASVFMLWSMHGELAGGAPWPPWWPAQVAALEQVLATRERLG